MSETNERSVASAGSVGEPVAFAVMQPDSYVVVHTRHAAVVRREMCGGGEIVPLYRQPQPTLTAAERTLIEKLTWESEHPKMGRSIWVVPQDRETAHGLLQRLK